jgi:polyhydroxybutyrate depolymerase
MHTQFKSRLKDVFQGASEAGTRPADVVEHSLLRPEGERRYLVAAPSQATFGRRPLVLVLHGGGASAWQVLGMAFPPSPLSVWLDIAEREGLVVIAPDAGKGGWSAWQSSATRSARKDDVAFIGALIDHAIANYRVDPDRVHVIGVSMGGFMACRLALEMPERLAAFSAVLASMPFSGHAPMPQRPLSALIFGCTGDRLVPYRGGRFFYMPLPPVHGIEDSVRMWREHNALPDTPSVHALARSPAGRTHATRFLWGDAADRVQVGLYKIEGAGHAEPSRRKRYPQWINWLVGSQNTDFEVAEAAWEFFKHKRASLRDAGAGAA